MRPDDLWALGASGSREELRDRLLRLMRDAEFERMSVQVFLDGHHTPQSGSWVANTPDEFFGIWSNLDAGIRCPVMQHVKRAHTPILYDQSTYSAAGAGSLWEEQAPFGYAAGVACALHVAQGRHVVIGFDRDQAGPGNSQERLRLMGQLQTILAYCAVPALRLLAAGSVSLVDPPRLTPREREVLHWTAVGKSASMTAEITGMSFSTVNFHLRNGMRKLGCHNKHVAACKAQALGIILP